MKNPNSALKTTLSLSKDGLMDTILKSDELPTLPTVASKLVTLTAREDSTLTEIAELVSQDIALSAKILKVANSAYYGFPQQIGSISQAISLIGTNAVQSLVLSFSFFSLNKIGEDSRFDFDQFLQRSLASASIANLVLEKMPEVDGEEVFIAGIMQNLGELILASTLPKEYEEVLAQIENDPSDPREVEVSVFGVDHCFIGYEVARHWSLPSTILLPLLHHHDPLEYAGDDEKITAYIRAIYLSNILVNIFYFEEVEKYHSQFLTEAQEMLGLELKQIEEIMEEAHTVLDQAAENFGLKMEETRSVQEIQQEANIRLSLANLDYEQVNRELVKAKIKLENLAKELQEKNETLKIYADVDGLTGVYNNRFFQEALDSELSRSRRRSYALSLLFIDIDHFKKFNDEYGHLVGDFVLAEFSQVLKGRLRQYDTLARYGGEEFVAVLPETDGEEAMVVAEKLRLAVESHKFRESGVDYSVTASFGISTVAADQEARPSKKDLIKMADEALYGAKKNGRNCIFAHGQKSSKKWFKGK